MNSEHRVRQRKRLRYRILASAGYGAAALAVIWAMCFFASPLLRGVALWSYRTEPWVMLSVYLLLGIALGILLHQGLAPLSRWLPAHQSADERDELAGHFMGVVAVIYAVVVGFVVVTAWQGRSDATSIATQEQHDVDNLYHLLKSSNVSQATDARIMLRYYAMYTQGEWYQMRNHIVLCADTSESNPECLASTGAISKRANELAHCIRDTTFGLDSAPRVEAKQTSSQERAIYDQAKYEEEIRTTEAFSEDRAERRLRYRDNTVKPVLWLSFVLGAFILVGMTYFVKGQGHRAQLVRTTALFGMMGMMIALALIFDQPFVGSMQVTPTAWETLVRHFDDDLPSWQMRGKDLHDLCQPRAERAPEPS